MDIYVSRRLPVYSSVVLLLPSFRDVMNNQQTLMFLPTKVARPFCAQSLWLCLNAKITHIFETSKLLTKLICFQGWRPRFLSFLQRCFCRPTPARLMSGRRKKVGKALCRLNEKMYLCPINNMFN